MKILRQFSIILFLSFLGEGLKMLLPLPIPASVYGLMLIDVYKRQGYIVEDTVISMEGEMKFQVKKKNFSSFQIISLGFLIVILTGGFLLMLPISTKEPGGAPFLDAMFTSTSAVCVTGLVLHDTCLLYTSQEEIQ